MQDERGDCRAGVLGDAVACLQDGRPLSEQIRVHLQKALLRTGRKILHSCLERLEYESV